MTAMGQSNALAVLAVGDRGTFLHAPDMYMEKLVVGPAARGAIDLDLPLAENLQNVAAQLGKPLSQLTVIVLAKPRHDGVIAQMQQLGVRVFAIPDGDVAASILTCMPESEVDVMYGIGGAPEEVISAAVIRALDGDMQARLLPRHEVKGDSAENRRIGEQELARCREMGIEAGQVLRMDQMARNDNVIFSATGITKGDLLEGISRRGNMATTETLLIRGKSRTIRRIRSTHYLDRKDPALHEFCCKPTGDRPQQPLRAGSSATGVLAGSSFPRNTSHSVFTIRPMSSRLANANSPGPALAYLPRAGSATTAATRSPSPISRTRSPHARAEATGKTNAPT